MAEIAGNEQVQFANTLRGIASISVLIAHYTGAFWTNNRSSVADLIHAPELPFSQYGNPAYLSWLHDTVPRFSWASFGVALFFLVSGFVIPFSLRRATRQSFLVGRFFRIVPLYMAGFSVTLLSIWLVGRYFGVPWPFSPGEVLLHYLPGVRDWFLFAVPSIDGIVWTLEIEVKFYLLCAIGIIWFRRQSVLVFLMPIALTIFGYWVSNRLMSWAVPFPGLFLVSAMLLDAMPYLIFMFIGVVFNYMHTGAIRADRAVFIATALFMLFAMMLASQVAPGLVVHCWNYGFAVVVFSFAASFPHLFRSTPLTNFFAKISYPLYVVHGVAGYVALRVLMDLGAKAWVSLIIVTAGAIGLAWLLHVFVEVPSHQLGKTLARRIRGRIQPQLIGAAAE